MKGKDKDNLLSWSLDLGVQLSRDQIKILSIYINELLLWRKRINLTGPSSCEDIIRELLLDSLLPSPLLPENGRLLDIGSGAGFPAIPLLIHRPERKGILIEASGKKVSFLKQVIRLTGISGVDVMRGRIGEISNVLEEGCYDIVTARALAPLPKSIGLCAPYLNTGGTLVSFQGPQIEEPLIKSREIIESYHLILHSSIPYILPGKETERNILLFKKSY